jgi:hypothetical protein
MWKKLLMSKGFISDLLKALAIIIARIYFYNFVNQLGDTLKLIVNLISIGIPLYFAYEWFKAFLRYKRRQDEQERFVHNLVEGLGKKMDSQNSTTNAELSNSFNASPKSLLTSAQIEQLNAMRAQIDTEEVKRFPMIRVSGSDMPNLVAGAGMFTAKIKRHDAIENLVVMLSTIPAVNDFERMCNNYGESPKDFWAEGYLLPSRTGICYSVLFVTAFRLCGKRIVF